ncbi:OmpA family protein [Phenylobacterium sp.]|uniref:OmpA family protein n=1 Tax=Phenylobacterium sp. TaxID=1871053 RepID=UPI00281250AD|nr:OmpA family protein [Phenylobacterium sp.]
MGMTRTTVLMMAAVVALAGCQTVRNARDRLVKSPPRCEDQTVQIYFEPDVAEVTPEGRQVIREAAAMTRGCTVGRVSVLGLADAAGDPNANLELSKKRAQSVTAALVAAQLPAAEFNVAAAGQAGAVTTDGRTAPLRRRVDVTLHMAK